MRVAMIGTGYVGLVSGACFADFGHEVTCVDKDSGKIAALVRGEVPIYEPGLNDLVAANTRARRLKFTNDLPAAVKAADAVFIAVGTPSRRGDGHADLSFVYDAAREIAAGLDGFTVVITKSTVPVGTGDEVERIIRETRPQAEFAVVSNPEFLREGAAIRDFKLPDRIVVGSGDERARAVMTELYRPLYLNHSPILFTDRRTADAHPFATALNKSLHGVPTTVHQAIGALGWNEFFAPLLAQVIWICVLGFAVHRALRRRSRWHALWLAAGLLLPTVVEVFVHRSIGEVWQGRYSTVFAIGGVLPPGAIRRASLRPVTCSAWSRTASRRRCTAHAPRTAGGTPGARPPHARRSAGGRDRPPARSPSA